ncbi:hypothetical protein C7410_115200 [Paraburkholderia silvatlantica]|uniref:Uncharacterized protein n=1 Tax=Paraburkholderia silvatlantica TaxID=321895 RepID=A0A2V4UAH2_9BURK|nr:hypothetical protein [Paraburkholderia silvatlantica]PYE21357.1 hypothetical protein C7410_115200 [Paraburkholderia silvatlantica]
MVIELKNIVDAIKILRLAEEISRETDLIKIAQFNGECRMTRWRLETAIAVAEIPVVALGDES